MSGARTSDEPSWWSRAITAVATGSVVLILTGILLGVTVGWGWLEGRAQRVLDRAWGEREAVIRVVWPALPTGQPGTWLAESFQREVLDLAQHQMDVARASLSPEPLRRVAEALGESGWFEGMPRVSREWGGAVTVRGVWRVPAAAIRWDGRDHVVSWDGRLMPPVYEPGVTNLRVIEGVGLGPPTKADGSRDFLEAWPGEDVAASLELVSELLRQPFAPQVAGVDASAWSKDRELVVLTPKGDRVVWGGRVSRPNIGEVSTPQKLRHLLDNDADTGSISAGFPVIYVNQERRLIRRERPGTTDGDGASADANRSSDGVGPPSGDAKGRP